MTIQGMIDTHLEARMANAIRALSMDAVQAANSGHPGAPMGVADIAAVLFNRFIKIDPTKHDWPDRDRFVMSAGHGSMLLYAINHLLGYDDMPMEEIKNFRQMGARTAGHPEYGHAKGIEVTTGPLSQGITTAVGMALAERMHNARFEAAGWHVQSVDGHDREAISAAIVAAQADPRPSMIACKTIIGFGMPKK